MKAKRPVQTILPWSLRCRFDPVQEIDRLIEGLQGVREKLNSDGDRLHREIGQYGAFSQSVIGLTKIVSDGMASVNKSNNV